MDNTVQKRSTGRNDKTNKKRTPRNETCQNVEEDMEKLRKIT